MSPPIRVLVVDDHGVVRRGLRSYLGIFDDLLVVGEAADGAEALDCVAELAAGDGAPDVVLMDLAMAPMDGVAATHEIRTRWPDVEIVALTSFAEEERVLAALDAGASAYLIKDAAPEELAVAIRAAHRGEIHLDGAVTRRMLGRPGRAPDPLGVLTEREREVLATLGSGHDNARIAAVLGISERTARTHVSNILRKLGMRSRTQAALLAARRGLVP